MKKLGLVFSGGDARTLAHAGLPKVLNENGIQPSITSGTSNGALVGGLYACGVAPEQMLDFFKGTPVFRWSMLTSGKTGLADNGKYTKFFQKYLEYPTFEDPCIPLSVTATNLLTNGVKYFSEGELIQLLIASSVLPPYFSSVKIGDGLYSDGGLLDNLPVESIRRRCEVTIDSFINLLEVVTENELASSFHSIQRIYSITVNGSYSHKFKKCDRVFFHNLSNIGVLGTKMLERTYRYGYE